MWQNKEGKRSEGCLSKGSSFFETNLKALLCIGAGEQKPGSLHEAMWFHVDFLLLCSQVTLLLLNFLIKQILQIDLLVLQFQVCAKWQSLQSSSWSTEHSSYKWKGKFNPLWLQTLIPKSWNSVSPKVRSSEATGNILFPPIEMFSCFTQCISGRYYDQRLSCSEWREWLQRAQESLLWPWGCF